VPAVVRHAVLAAEDRDFYSHRGVSPSGVGRAAWDAVRLQDQRGHGTITEQLIHLDGGTDTRGVARRWREMVQSVKGDRRYAKDYILERYLNAVYFGRGAYGIATAAEAYFGVPVDKLGAEQGALLAALIHSPADHDPVKHRPEAEARWRYVLNGMAQVGWLDEKAARDARFPAVARRDASNWTAGVNGTVASAVERQLSAAGVSREMLEIRGLRVITTLDPKAQAAATAAMEEGLGGSPRSVEGALVAVQPGSGEIRAYYGGDAGYQTRDLARLPHPAGGTMHAFVLADAVRAGISPDAVWDGSSPLAVAGRAAPIQNEGGVSCAKCTLEQSLAKSLDTPYWALAQKLGPAHVAELTSGLGIRLTKNSVPVSATSEIALGTDEVTPVAQAGAFAAFANGGTFAAPHLVSKIIGADGSVAYATPVTSHRVVDGPVAATMTGVLTRTAGGPGPAAGLAAGANSGAWMVGYTPKLAVSVWMGKAGAAAPSPGKSGKAVNGTAAAAMWRNFLDHADGR
jgi:membrane peptidoglycan carboxypeptidase